jgi:hypothetical protein
MKYHKLTPNHSVGIVHMNYATLEVVGWTVVSANTKHVTSSKDAVSNSENY